MRGSIESPHSWIRSPLFWLFAALMLVFMLCYSFRPLSDPDFWWHLKSGEQMWQAKGLLQNDIFTYTGDGQTTWREILILKSYWLWQLLAYGLYALAGFNGVFVLNLMVLVLMVSVLTRLMQIQKVSLGVAVSLLTLAFLLLSYTYALERPQVVSFLFAAILIGLLSRLRDGDRLNWLLPLLMLLWANMHGGFIVGGILLILFAAAAVLVYRSNPQLLRHVLLWVSISLLASLLNPAGALAYLSIFEFYNTQLMMTISEYRSTFSVFMLGEYYVAILWFLVGCYGLGLWFSRRIYWPEIVMALFLSWFSVMHLRNAGFFSLAMLPAVGFGLQQGLNQLPGKLRLVLAWLFVLLSLFGLGYRGWDFYQERVTQGEVSPFYPSGVVEFLSYSGLRGYMFNSYAFGGYLQWRLYPQQQVFIDGRGMEPQVYEDWRLISSASLEKGAAGQNKYEELLAHYKIDYVVHPLAHLWTGRITPLVKFLLNKPEWYPVYLDAQSYVLVRASAKNQQVIDRYALNKRDFVEKIILYLQTQTLSQPDNILPRVALAEMLIFFARYDQAQVQIDAIRRIQPKNPEVPKLLNQLQVLQYGE